MSLIDIHDVSKVYKIGGVLAGAELRAVDHVTLAMSGDSPTILSIVGESGSGKTTLARMILRLIEPTSGTIAFSETNGAAKQDGAAFRRLVQPIFQNPFDTFSLRRKVAAYLFDTALLLGIARTKSEARQVVADALTSVGLNLAYVAGKYPSHFSGGELQRLSIARALICRPKLIVADEPVAMIDASLKMNIVNLFLKLKDEYQVSFVYITHDLSTAYYVSDHIAIMYRGNVVEYGPASAILTAPAHPYTQLLMASIPTVGTKWEGADGEHDDAEATAGDTVASTACKFARRCPYARDICRTSRPPLVAVGEERQALCYKPVDYRADVREVVATHGSHG